MRAKTAAQLAFVAFPRGVPQLAVDPGHAGDEAVGLDGPLDRTRGRIDADELAGRAGPGRRRISSAHRRLLPNSSRRSLLMPEFVY